MSAQDIASQVTLRDSSSLSSFEGTTVMCWAYVAIHGPGPREGADSDVEVPTAPLAVQAPRTGTRNPTGIFLQKSALHHLSPGVCYPKLSTASK